MALGSATGFCIQAQYLGDSHEVFDSAALFFWSISVLSSLRERYAITHYAAFANFRRCLLACLKIAPHRDGTSHMHFPASHHHRLPPARGGQPLQHSHCTSGGHAPSFTTTVVTDAHKRNSAPVMAPKTCPWRRLGYSKPPAQAFNNSQSGRHTPGGCSRHPLSSLITDGRRKMDDPATMTAA